MPTVALAMVLPLVPVAALLLLAVHPLLTGLSLTELTAVMTAGLCVGVAVLIPPSRDLAERLLDRDAHRVRTNPPALLRRASAELGRDLDLGHLTTVVLDTIHASVEPEGVALYLERDRALRLALVRTIGRDAVFVAPPEPPTRILHDLTTRRATVVRDDIDLPGAALLREAFAAANWALALPLVSDERLVGLVAIGPKRSGDPFYAEDLDALIALANHAGSALKELARQRARAESFAVSRG